MVGDADKVPAYYRTSHPDIDEGPIATDLYYSTVDGWDYYPDIFIGRLPVSSSSDAEEVISKILEYNKAIYSNSNWYDDQLFAAYFQDDDSDGDEDRTYLMTIEEIRTYIDQQYDCTRVYTHSSGTTPKYYNDGSSIPSTVNFYTTRSAATQAIIDAINSGKSLISHRDHGMRTGWWEPRFTITDAANLNNLVLPVMFSINCQSGWFDDETDHIANDNDDCFGEELLERRDGGVVGFIGASRASYTTPNEELIKGMFDSIFPDFQGSSSSYRELKCGPILTYGKIFMQSNSSVYPREQFEMFNLLGDPEMSIRLFEELYSGDSDNINLSTGLTKIYKININVSDAYKIQTSAYLDGCDTVITLYDENWNQIGYDDDGGYSLYSKIVSSLEVGVYYIKVQEYDSNDPLQCKIEVAENIYLNDSKRISLETGNQKTYLFELSSSGTYIFETADYINNNCDTRMYLYDETWNQIGYDDDGGTSVYSKISQTLDVGRYYIKVEEYGNNAPLVCELEIKN